VRRTISLLAALAMLLMTAAPAGALPGLARINVEARTAVASGSPDHAAERGQVGRDRASGSFSQARVVVAAIDSAINPYHEFFHHGGEGPWSDEPPNAVTRQVLNEFGIGRDQILSLTRTGHMEANLAADEEQWAKVEKGTPYWFEGTNVIAISFAGDTAGFPFAEPVSPLKPHEAKSPHGMGVAAAVFEANSEAIVVLVEGITSESEQWAFTHSAVDIVTTSYGPIGSPPFPWHLDFSFTGVVENGKLHFGAVDNSPGLSPIDTTGGPWWSIGIAGYQEGRTNGRQMRSGTAADFIAKFTHDLPYCMDCQEGRDEDVSGTSFASPRSAGVASAAILEARRQLRHVGGVTEDGVMIRGPRGAAYTNWDVRRALEEAAAYPTIADFDPTGVGWTVDLSSAPVLDPAPYALAGWGLITPAAEYDVVGELLAHLGVTGEPSRFKDGAACDFMTAKFETRYFYWNNYAFMGESYGTDEDPYVRC
jgi:hypothetical protein